MDVTQGEGKATKKGGVRAERRAEKRKRQFSVQSPSTLRDELIYCQICWWIIDNLSQAPQSSSPAIAAHSDRTPGGARESPDINIRE